MSSIFDSVRGNRWSRKTRKGAFSAQQRAKQVRQVAALESLEERCLLAYNPVTLALAPLPIEGTMLAAGTKVATFVTGAAVVGATVAFPSGTTSAIIVPTGGTEFVPGIGPLPEFWVEYTGTWTPPDEASAVPFTVTITDAGGTSVIAGATPVADAPLSNIVPTNPVAPFVEGNPGFTPLALFTDGNTTTTSPADFTGTVDWGDGTPVTAANFFTNVSVPGGYLISATHTYAEPGVIAGGIKVTFQDKDSPTVYTATTGPVTITHVAITPFFTPTINAVTGAPLTHVDVADFVLVPGNPSDTGSDFSASIQWGDGTTSAGTVVKDALGVFHVEGSHTYAPGSPTNPPLSVVVTENADLTNIQVINNPNVTVATSALLLTAGPLVVQEGTTIPTGTVLGTFVDTNGAEPVANFSGVANFPGLNGMPVVLLTFTQQGTSNAYTVTTAGPVSPVGGFDEGVTNYNLRITDTTATTTTTTVATGTLTVTDAPLTVAANLFPSTVPEGTTVSPQVLVFNDANLNATTADFTATINWGDGTPVSTGIVGGPFGPGVFNVSGTHTYTEAGVYTVSYTVKDDGGQTVSGSGTTTVIDAALALSGQPAIPVNAAEGQLVTGIPLGTFVDANPFATAADFTGLITWGDGTPFDVATFTRVGTFLGGSLFLVTGSHTYTSLAGSGPGGTFTINVAITDDDGSTLALAPTTATVTQSPIYVSVLSSNATAAAPIPAGLVVGGFKDLNGDDVPTVAIPVPYTATLRWGDGTQITSTSGALVIAPSPFGGFTVTTTVPHTYATPGLYPLTLIVTDSDPTAGVGGGFILVAPAALTGGAIIGAGGPVLTTEGTVIPPSTQVLDFTYGDPTAVPSDFSATLDWGDGTGIQAGTVGQFSPGSFFVAGGHTYAETGSYTLTITVTDKFGQRLIRTAPVTVADATLSNGRPVPFVGNEGNMQNNVPVAIFEDANPLATPADFITSIVWGDGSPATPGVVTRIGTTAGGHAIFQVTGTHTFTTSVGLTPVVVTVTDEDNLANTLVITGPIAAITPGLIEVDVLPIAATAGVATGTGVPGTPSSNELIATFTDDAGADLVTEYSAVVSWGDNTPNDVTPSIINPLGTLSIIPLGGGQYGVYGTHIYAQPGIFRITVTVTDSDPGTGVGGNIAFVLPASIVTITATPAPGPILGVLAPGIEGQPIPATPGLPLGPNGTELATFIVSTPGAVLANYTAQIDWGDGSPQSVGQIIPDPAFAGDLTDTHFIVLGHHTYIESSDDQPTGSYLVTVTVTQSVPGSIFVDSDQIVSVTDSIVINDAALTAGSVLPLFATEHAALTDVPVATFVDANPFATAADFTGEIDWGDGTFDRNVRFVLISSGPNTSSSMFAVYGSHTYTKSGTFPVTVQVADEDGNSLPVSALTGTVTVAATPIVVTGLSVGPFTIDAPTPVGLPVATFIDTASTDPVSNYTATIDWGDGSPTSIGTVVALGGGQFKVLAPAHTYLKVGPFAITTTVVDSDGSSGIGSSLAFVNDSVITATPAPGGPITGTVEGAPRTFTVAAFTDTDILGVPSDYTATIDWGDGSPQSAGTIVAGAVPGSFLVQGKHTYADESGPLAITVVITDTFGGKATTTTILAGVADAALTAGTTVPIFGTEHVALNDVTVGTFIDANPLSDSGDFVVAINWGDGPSTPGFATLVGGSPAGYIFAVHGSHLYAKANTYPTTFTVTDVGGSTLVNAAGGLATISQSPILVVVQPVVATVGVPTTPGVIATFTDGNGPDPAGSYTVTIDWGDSSPTGVGTVLPLGGNQFSVTAPAHTYTKTGDYVLKVTVVDIDPATGIGANLVIVQAETLTASPAPGGPIIVNEGTPLVKVPVATFTSNVPTAVAGNFTATIDWGDGSPISAGTITQPGGPGTAFLVTGNHTYAEEDATGYTIHVVITDASGVVASTSTVADVNDATLVNPVGIPEFSNDSQVLLNAPLGTFADNNPLATAADFTATINWGDLSPTSLGFVNLIGGNATQALFSVSGTHLYTSPGVKTVTITVVDDGGQTTTITTTVTVAANPLALVLTIPGPVLATEGIPTAGGVIATFTDVPGDDPVGNYSVTINYGDGSPIDTTATVVNNGNGTYNVVAGPHTFLEEGTYPVTVSVTDSDSPGAPAIAVALATVKDAILTGINAPAPINVVEGTPIGFQQLVTFTDANPKGTVSDFTAVVDWGDGTTSPGTISQPFGPGTAFLVSGNHNFTEEGTYTATVTITDVGGSKTTATVTIVVAEATITITPGGPLAVLGVQDTALTLVDVSTFTSANPTDTASTFVATIYWGDLVGGVPTAKTAGTIVKDANGVFHVEGNHTYLTAGSFPITVTIGEVGDPGIFLDQSQTATATIKDNPLLLTSAPITATEGLPVPSAGTSVIGGTVLATFVDLGGADPILSYTATINWGDPTSPSTLGAGTVGIIVPLAGGVNNQNYAILAPAGVSYLDAGNFTITITLQDNDPGGSFQVFTANSVNVLDANLTAAAVQPILSGTQGVPIVLTLGPVVPGGTRAALANFTDANPSATAADFTATVDWGDGSPQSAGQVIANPAPAGVGFTVTGNHTYANPSGAQPYTVTVTVRDEEGKTVTITSPLTVAASTITPGAPITLTAVESQPLVNVVVATFTDSGLAGPISSYSAVINWGAPGSAPTFGQIIPIGGNTFEVVGTFTYPEESGPASLPIPYSITVNISHNGTLAAVATGSALVSDAPVSGVAIPVFAIEGAAFTGSVAIFQDTDLGTPADPTTNPADYTATINWGDGTTSTGTITFNGGSFLVSARDPASGLGHVFSEQGSFPFSVTVRDQGGAFFTAFQTATVGDAALSATGINTTTTEGPLPAAPLPGTVVPTFNVATFTDAGNNLSIPGGIDTPSEYVATINWGDGTTTSGIVSFPSIIGGVPTYTVSGQHLYKDEGTFQTTVTIKDVDLDGTGTATTTTSGAITITDAALTPTVPAAVAITTAVEGVPFTLPIANFTDADPSATIDDFATTITWGDGTSSAGIIGQLTTGVGSPTQFTVTGTHTYGEESPTGVPYAISVSIKDLRGGNTQTIANTATVLDAPLTSAGTSIQGVEGNPLPIPIGIGNGILVATIQDSNPLATVADFTTGTGTVTLDWGDGSALVTIPAANITAVGSAAGVTFKVVGGPHVYAEEGSYKITVTATDAGGAATIAHSEADIADGALTPAPVQPIIPALTSGFTFTTPVAVFVDANPAGTVDDFTATIDWGDGTPRSTGTISQPQGPGTPFLVTGSHNYVNPFVNNGTGKFPIIVNVHDKGGASTVVTNTAPVNPILLALTGQLDPASDSGKSHTDGITNVNQPRFFGTAEQYSTVTLFAAPTGTNKFFVIGQTQADGSGAWSIVSARLADGSYTITAQQTNRSGVTNPNFIQVMPNAGQGPLVIDTVGPRITSASFDRFTSTATFTFQDFTQNGALGGSGLLVQSLVDSANYSLKQIVKVRGHLSIKPLVVTSINVTPGGNPFTENVTVVFNNGNFLVGGYFQVIARAESVLLAGGIQDVAGNALDGEFFGPSSATGNGLPGGDFVANFTVFHNRNSGPQTIIGFPHPNDPPAHFPAPTRTRRNPSRGKSVKAAAVTTVSSAPSSSVALHDAALAGVVVKKK